MRKHWALILFLVIGAAASLNIYATFEKKAISDGVLRLHVVAKSNSQKDQELKIKVRDAVLSEGRDIFMKVGTKEEAMRLACENKEKLERIAENTLRKEGCFQKVSVDVGKTNFPTKVYGNIRLPGGKYDSVNIKIGEAKGENWWCVMYPALCFSEGVTGKIDSDGERILKNEIGEKRFNLITETNDEKINIKFKILEIF